MRTLLPAVLIIICFAAFSMGARAPSGVNAVSVIDPSERLSASAEATLVHELQPDFRSSDALPATLVFTGLDALLLFVALAVVLLILVIGAATDYSLLYAPRFQAEATVQRLSTKLDAPAFGDQLLVGRDTAVALDTRDASSHDGDLIIPVVLAVIALSLVMLRRSIVAPFVWRPVPFCPSSRRQVFRRWCSSWCSTPPAPTFPPRSPVSSFWSPWAWTATSSWRPGSGWESCAALEVLPVLFLSQPGFIVAFGVLLDTLVVRSLLDPALASDLGEELRWSGHSRKA